ncbi:MAG: HAD-IIIC family phosphatase [Ferruginibacter sp.]
MENKTFQELKRNLKKDFTGLRTVKLALLGDSATQMLVQAIKGYGYVNGIKFEVFEADYDQVELQVYDSGSELYQFDPEFIVVFYCTNKLHKKFGKLSFEAKAGFASHKLEEFSNLVGTINSRLSAKILFFNFNEVDEALFGNFANKTPVSFTYQQRKLNLGLMDLSQQVKNLFIIDLNLLQSRLGHGYVTDNKIYVNTELFFSVDFLPVVAKAINDIILSVKGSFKKCLILDLDNTTWGGIIGDDGVENIQIGDLGIGKAFSELQLWAKQLKQRGIILAICSKNDEANAKEPFEKHPDMILRLDDIAVFVANWNNKADNIRYIQSVLNIGFDSMVFLDDNPFERNLVRTNIPEVTVPELPEDPAEYLAHIRGLNLFETASFTAEDEQRTKQYQEEANRAILQQQFTNENDFLKSLNMVSVVEPFNKFNTPRVAQLTQRSNQFNLRTIRYTEEEVTKVAESSDHITMAFSLADKYGDYGLISLVILKRTGPTTLFIDTWIMSCRVLKRNMENFVLNSIVKQAGEKGFATITGEYLPTPKNGMVKDHYQNLGFTYSNELWQLQTDDFETRECYIEEKLLLS